MFVTEAYLFRGGEGGGEINNRINPPNRVLLQNVHHNYSQLERFCTRSLLTEIQNKRLLNGESE